MSQITVHNSGVTYDGPDAVSLFRATVLAASLRLYARSKILTNRGLTPTRLLVLASQITHKTYKRGEHAKAADDVKTWADNMRLALPVVDERKEAQS